MCFTDMNLSYKVPNASDDTLEWPILEHNEWLKGRTVQKVCNTCGLWLPASRITYTGAGNSSLQWLLGFRILRPTHPAVGCTTTVPFLFFALHAVHRWKLCSFVFTHYNFMLLISALQTRIKNYLMQCLTHSAHCFDICLHFLCTF